MSLKEITDLIGVRHDKACLKVLSMAEEAEFGTVSIVDIVYNDKGQTIQTIIIDPFVNGKHLEVFEVKDWMFER